TFVLADGMNVTAARLENGLLIVSLERPEPRRVVRRIEIGG
ncbi:MAG: heat-shock protein Hsp20, partial [Aestuariivirga sp.]